jgi:ribose transport system ATP-binding protein
MSTHSDSGLSIEDLSKAFFGVAVLKSLNLEIHPGCVLGLVGQNGAGKSTLMNIIGGNLQADSGTMRLHDQLYRPATPREASRNGIGMVHQELNLFPNLSIAENLFMNERSGFRRFFEGKAIRRRATDLLANVGLTLNPDWLVARLSAGQQQLVEIARVIAEDSRVLLFDEPTTSLSAVETEQFYQLTRKLADEGRIIVLITHAIRDVLRHCDRVAVLRDGHLVSESETATVEASWLIEKMIDRPLDQLYPEPKRSHSIDSIKHKHGVEADSKVTDSTADKINRSDTKTNVLLKVDCLSHPRTLSSVSFDVFEGEVVGLFGLMGAGRSELARMLMGIEHHDSGNVILAGDRLSGGPRSRSQKGLGLVTENRRHDGFLPESSISNNMTLVAIDRFASRIGGFTSRGRLRDSVRRTRAAVRMQPHLKDKQLLKTLSGGNQQKAILGKWIMNQCRMLILDEPTRGIDAKRDVYQWIYDFADQGNGVLVISSELEELMGICDRILVMSLGAMTGEFQRSSDRDDPYQAQAILEAAFARHGSSSSMEAET